MEIGHGWEAWGLPGLFLAAFLAATIVPFSSELLLGTMAAGSWSGTSLWLVASVGNTLGGLTNYAIGRWIPEQRLARRLRIDPDKADRWRGTVQRFGAWSALLCWLPVIGDPIALVLGLFRAPLVHVAALMFLGKAARYAVVLFIVYGVLRS